MRDLLRWSTNVTRRKPYPRVTLSGDAAARILALSTHWQMTPEEVVRRLCDQATIGRTATAVVQVGAALVSELFAPTPKELPRSPEVTPPSRRLF